MFYLYHIAEEHLKYYFTQSLIKTRGCVIILNQSHLDKFTRRKIKCKISVQSIFFILRNIGSSYSTPRLTRRCVTILSHGHFVMRVMYFFYNFATFINKYILYIDSLPLSCQSRLHVQCFTNNMNNVNFKFWFLNPEFEINRVFYDFYG